MPSRPIGRLMTVLLAAMMLIALLGRHSTARADPPPPFIDWTALLPGLVDEYIPDSTNDCVAGRPRCVDAAIREMERRFTPAGQSCHHGAVFALGYLRTTQTFRWASNQPGFFADSGYVNHEAAVFAKYYFNAYDRWAGNDRTQVPPAWLVAFDAAQSRRLTASGNLFLGMSAHINRDLPFVLAAIGLTTATGQSRKPDHDKVNQFLNLVTQPLLNEEVARFDPSTINISTPFGVGYTGFFLTIQAWRELAWRNAELLVAAPTPAARALVAQDIEISAATQANVLALANSYLPPVTTSAARDAYCATHHAAAPPMAYAFGTPPPY